MRDNYLSLEEVISALQKRNITIPGGKIRGSQEFSIRTTGEFYTQEDIEDVVIRANEIGNWLRIRDVAGVRFAFEDEEEHLIRILITLKDHQISIEMVDDGIPFNPMEYNPTYQSDPAAVDDGGMGLTLIKAFADSIEYSRVGQNNRLFIRKFIRSNPDPEIP